MKKGSMVILLLAAFFLGCGGEDSASRATQRDDDPYAVLDSYGVWMDVAGLGQVWQPTGLPADWRPFTDGQWIWTDRGWMWDSNEPFGWVVYHYGTWTREDPFGWVWVPSSSWSPAQVQWYSGDQFVGWAPAPPRQRMLTPIFDSGFDNVWVVVPTQNFTQSNVGKARGSSIPVRPGTRRTSDGNRAPSAEVITRVTGAPVRLMKLDKENVPAGHQTLVKPTLRQADDAPVVPAAPPIPPISTRPAPLPIAPAVVAPAVPVTKTETTQRSQPGSRKTPSAAKSPSSRNKKDDPKVEKPKEQPLTPVKPATPEKKVD